MRRGRAKQIGDVKPWHVWAMELRPLTWTERWQVGFHRWLNEEQAWPLPVPQTDDRFWLVNNPTGALAALLPSG